MTREEAIKLLEHISIAYTPTDAYGDYDDPQPYEEAIDMAIEALTEAQKHEETFEWRTDCKEYDKDNYCCHRWSKMIRNTVEELKEYDGFCHYGERREE